jgi:hypothetical protein
MDFVSPERNFQVGRGFALAKALFVASGAGVIAAAGGGATLTEIAARTGLPERSTRRICDLLVTAAAAVALAESYDLAAHRRVLDVGGGLGTFLLPILYELSEAAAWLAQTGWRPLGLHEVLPPQSLILAEPV